MTGKLLESDPFEWAKTSYNDDHLRRLLNSDLQSVISMVLSNDGGPVLGSLVGAASVIQIMIEDAKLDHLDDKLPDSENTLRDWILFVVRYAYATNHLVEFVRRYNSAKVDLQRKTAYRDNFPNI